MSYDQHEILVTSPNKESLYGDQLTFRLKFLASLS